MPGPPDVPAGSASRRFPEDNGFEEIERLARGYWGPRVLLTAVDLDLFSALGRESLGVDRLANAIGADPRGVELLAKALASMGLLVADGRSFACAPVARRFLDSASPEYRGHAVRLASWWWRQCSDLTEVVRTGRAIAGPPSDVVEEFTLAMHQGKPEAGHKLAASIDLGGVESVVDLGTGAGTFAEALALALPGALVVAIDRPEVLRVARRRMPAELLENRVRLVAADFMSGEIPAPGKDRPSYDLALLSSVLHLIDEDANVALLRKVRDVLASGGRVVIRDFLVDDAGTGPREAVLFAITMLVTTRSGRCYSYAQVAEFLRVAGFVDVERIEFEGAVALITARNP